MALIARIPDTLRDSFKGELALRGLQITEGIDGLIRHFLEDPEAGCRLIGAYLDGKEAGTRASKPTKQPGGSRSARRKYPSSPASGVDAPAERKIGIRRRGTNGKR